ncbi:hypothetical protein KIN20_030851 [Parelaphostrongylus tenuis]|uniref:Uncharacterized protein n=1 Tax=Parelaphostrongylus tenuis TaxID=148309 RepID=A0AAD5R4P3_PARTN|nr:hypothetical protein KIN20_030851 [Parelaphostrongylus tenuis]
MQAPSWKRPPKTMGGRVCGQRQPPVSVDGNEFGFIILEADHHHGRQLRER